MAWTTTEGSHVFRAFLTDLATQTAAFDLNTNTINAALFPGTITPDENVASAASAYNAGVWTAAAEIDDPGEWDTGGEALTTPTVTNPATDVVMFDAADTASGTAATLADVHGCLVYDGTLATPVADQGVCFNYFGGANSVTNGTFTIVWNANGIWRATV